MAKSKFQNLTVDVQQLKTLSIADRLDFLKSREGGSILPNFTPSQLNDLFPWYYRRSFTDIGEAFKAVSDKRNLAGGVSGGMAESSSRSTSGLFPRSARDAAAAGQSAVPAWQRAVKEKYGVDMTEGNVRDAAELIKRKEGLIFTPKYDRNAYRVGYGSDTITLPDGSYKKVTPDMRITKEDAERDLRRRIPEFQRNGIIQYVGQNAWDKLNETTKAALTSLAYNYGSISRLDALKRAIAAGDKNMIAQAIESYSSHNEGINYSRRMEEARMVKNSSDSPSVATEIPQLPQGLDPKLVEEYNRMPAYQQRNFHRALNKMGENDPAVGVNIMNRVYQENPGRVDQISQQSASPLPPGSTFERGTYNPGRIRNLPLKEELRTHLNYAAEKSGVYFETTSLGQRRGEGTGSHRHDEGGAADMRLYIKDQDGKKIYLDTRNEAHKPYIENFTRNFASVAPGAGVGTNYMSGDPYRLFHFGGPNQPGGAPIAYSGPDWFKNSFNRGRESFGTDETKANLDDYIARRKAEMEAYEKSRARPSQSIPQSLQIPGAPAGAVSQQQQQPQATVVPSGETLPGLVPGYALGGNLQTDAKQLQAHSINKSRQRRDDMVVTDGNQPLFTMNSEEEMKFNPATGKVSVNPSPQGLKTNPEALTEKMSPTKETQETQSRDATRDVKQEQDMSQQPIIIAQSPATPAVNSYDVIRDRTLEKMTPSFERAVARSRFLNSGDSILGGHFDFGAANMS